VKKSHPIIRMDQSKKDSKELRMLLQKTAREQRTEPFLVGGQPWFSSSTAIEPLRFVWDTNSFYRRLGVEPSATRGEIGVAYRDNPNRDDPYLTHIAKTLVDKSIRLRYDWTPLGMFWSDDQRLQHAIEEALDQSGEIESLETATGSVAEWGFFVLGVDQNDVEESSVVLWRSAVIECLSQFTEVPPIAVGIGAQSSDPTIVVRDKRIIFFAPNMLDDQLARQYASDVVASVATIDPESLTN